ncbi:hypothetical protein ES288_D11G114100v1 [Gossypium darwinii]|uniref:Uncharacterized protein n=1 Tax=Gossypium darwinii TaxID=34276 RepID=A0A5D2AIN5_GOSDA|nr:hypothetical protein ES288_D11G114100v1 [Gossypium darwinii]
MLLSNFCKLTPHFQLKIIIFFPPMSATIFFSHFLSCQIPFFFFKTYVWLISSTRISITMIIIMLLCNFCKPTPHFQLKIIVFFPPLSAAIFFLSFSLLPNTIFLLQNIWLTHFIYKNFHYHDYNHAFV